MSDKHSRKLLLLLPSGLLAASLLYVGIKYFTATLSFSGSRSKKLKGPESTKAILSEQKRVLADENLIIQIREEAIAWCNTHGLTMVKDHEKGYYVHAPVTLLPSLYPREAYDRVKDLACVANRLLDAVSRDYPFLISSLNSAGLADPQFTGRLLEILQVILSEGETQPLRLGLHRNDFMLHCESEGDRGRPLQVEFNSISASFGCLSHQTSKLHRYIISRHFEDSPLYHVDNLPANQTLERIPKALAFAANMHPHKSERGVVLMVVQENERNASDQRFIEYELWKRFQIPLLRRTLGYIQEHSHINGDKDLEIDGKIALVTYFRAGYVPKDYPSESQWQAVLKIERSRSIKCPSVAYHLSGTKKIQQVLALPGALERFVTKAEAEQIRLTFAGLWGLDASDDLTEQVIKRAIASPDDFVLKPQREGGGNNIWGAQLVEELKGDVNKRSAYILMQRLKCPSNPGVYMREGKVEAAPCFNEIGIYASFLGDGRKVYLNESCGHLLRTKKEGVNEGGVASGFAVLDSPILY